MAGQIVRQTNKETLSAGSHIVKMSSSGLATGSYFYVLKAHNVKTMEIRMLTKKMVVIK